VLFRSDNGHGIGDQKKESIFSYWPGVQEGMGLFLVREILGVTGLSIYEEGEPGKGARFVIRAPEGRFRVV